MSAEIQPKKESFSDSGYKGLLLKAKDLGTEAQSDLKGTLEGIFDIHTSPNFFQVVWLIVFCLTVGVLILSNSVFVSSLSVVAVVLLVVGAVGYAIYSPKSFSLFSTNLFKKAKDREEKVDTEAATKALFSTETPTITVPDKLELPPKL